jgi:hypothetical protein
MMFREEEQKQKQTNNTSRKRKHHSPSSIEDLRTCMLDIIKERKTREASDDFKTKQKESAKDGIEEICFPNFSPLFKNELAFREFCEHVLCMVVGKTQMGTMGQRFGTRKNSYLKAITFSNEQFALMVLDDRWELWERLAKLRLEKDKKKHDLAHPREQGTKKPKNRVDEDDQRKLDRTCQDTKADKVPGSNLTRYSMWGIYCPDKKGFGDGYPAMLSMNESLGGHKQPLRRSPEMVLMRKKICDWWGTHKYTGPKRKKEKFAKRLTVQRHIDMSPMIIIDDDEDEELLYNTQAQADVNPVGEAM